MVGPDKLAYTLLTPADSLLLQRCRRGEERLAPWMATSLVLGGVVGFFTLLVAASTGFESFRIGSGLTLGLCAFALIPAALRSKLKRCRRMIAKRGLSFVFIGPARELEEKRHGLNELLRETIDRCRTREETQRALELHYEAACDLLRVPESDDQEAALAVFESAQARLKDEYGLIRSADERRAMGK